MAKLSWWKDPAVIARWHQEYHPCEDGIHVFQPEGGEFGGLTIRNYPHISPEVFRRLSSAGEDDDFDIVCDVMQGGDLLDTVTIRRQDLAVIEAALKEQNNG